MRPAPTSWPPLVAAETGDGTAIPKTKCLIQINFGIANHVGIYMNQKNIRGTNLNCEKPITEIFSN
jgi:hypothetical protein